MYLHWQKRFYQFKLPKHPIVIFVEIHKILPYVAKIVGYSGISAWFVFLCFLEGLRGLPVKWGTQKRKLYFLILCCLTEWNIGAWAGTPSIQKKKTPKIKWNCILSLFDNAFNDFGMQRDSLGKVTYHLGVLGKVLPGPWAETALVWLCDW